LKIYGEADVTVSTVMFKVPPAPGNGTVGIVEVKY